MSRMIVVKAAFDPEARVWFTEDSDIHGLRLEASTLESLVERIPSAVQDLLEEAGETIGDTPIEVIAHASTRLPARQAA